ncbi:ATP-grasp domain-containing protein [Dethiosulfatibacter aminovorans DSM 17477]|uniref:ATP-grasp domain-containing protein n=1 Tax=Dethiosulfatibacter aminovorans DSM 17477 TaxID=1121476 RepID=A0A1M6K3A7_9FIRM|nr:ATP-grasp domain-containing protein [Dethiosulfatibacter aminovorans]SHJ53461.1 ATP-grasp domain-containing protein [Dethiosulfatibacter aminovorans DSM 17477]
MKFIVLGGSNCQVSLIKGLKKRGHEVVLCDYFSNPPGKEYADVKEDVSTFDVDGIVETINKHNVDGILTAGTDQPVYTGALASEKTGLNFYIASGMAKKLTNKKLMKDIFTKHDIPTVAYRYIKRNYKEKDIEGLDFPVVIKPFDSQGQRGVLKIDSMKELEELIDETFSFTEEDEILIEEFYENDEITVSGWVVDGKAHILSITDRVTFDLHPHIGICTSHNFPSKHYDEHGKEIIRLTEALVKAFAISHGPIYFQMLAGAKGVLVNETAARIGGAFEDVYIKYLTGVDMHTLLLNDTLKKKNHLGKDNYVNETSEKLNVVLFFARPGKIVTMDGISKLIEERRIIDGAYNFKAGDELGEIKNATLRAGHFIVAGSNEAELKKNIQYAFDNMRILDENGKNLLIKSV